MFLVFSDVEVANVLAPRFAFARGVAEGRASYEASVAEALGWPERSADKLPGLIATVKAMAGSPTTTPESLNTCAWFLLAVEPTRAQDHNAALRAAQRACDAERHQRGGQLWSYLDTLALAQHRTGRSAEAVITQREANSLVPATGEPYRAEMLGRLAEYEAAPQR